MIRACRIILVVIAVWLLISPPALPQERRVFTVPFRIVNGLILLDATVNGQPAVLLLDTGARTTLLSNLSAPTLQLSKPTYTGQSVRADLRLGSHTIASTFVVVNLEQAKKQVGASFDGILGQDVLRQFSAVRIDYKNHVVELESK